MRRTVLLLLARASCVGGVFAGRIPCDKWLGPGCRYSGHYDADTDLRDHLEQLRLRAKQGSRKDPRIKLWERAVVDTYDLKRITADHCEDDDDSDGDFEPGPRTTTASARRRSPRLIRR